MAKKETVQYVTSHPTSVLFDIQARGDVIRGKWLDYPEKKRVTFVVPADLVDAFEAHFHFQSGTIVRYEPTSEPINDDAKAKKPKEPKEPKTPAPAPAPAPAPGEGEPKQ